MGDLIMSLPMSLLERGAYAIVKDMRFKSDIIQQLFNFGIKPGVKFKVILKSTDFIIRLGQAKVGIDKALCSNIIVSIL